MPAPGARAVADAEFPDAHEQYVETYVRGGDDDGGADEFVKEAEEVTPRPGAPRGDERKVAGVEPLDYGLHDDGVDDAHGHHAGQVQDFFGDGAQVACLHFDEFVGQDHVDDLAGDRRFHPGSRARSVGGLEGGMEAAFGVEADAGRLGYRK
jgi:hypothetical protein